MSKTEQPSEVRYTGGCLCGHIRFELTSDPFVVSICHCTHCQRVSGSAFSINCMFPVEALTYSQTPAAFKDIGDSGDPVYRLFCGKCGSPLQSRATATAAFAVMKAGAFDAPEAFTPTMEFFCRSALPWLKEDLTRRRFEILPTAT